jgi:uncharacterized iron-regulated membrane protein
MYAWPNAVEGGSVQQVEAERVVVTPAEAISKANELAGKQLPTTALTLLMKDGRPQYQSIGGMGADSIFIDAETGEARVSEPPTWKTAFFRQAHFYFFAGSWQVALLVLLSGLAALSAFTGIYLNIVHWSTKMSPRRRRYYTS